MSFRGRLGRIFLLALLVFISFQIPLFLKKFTKGFHLARFEVAHRVQSWNAKHPSFTSDQINAPLDKTILQALESPFLYLGRGAQCYAFESQDHQYVLKVFHENRETTPFTRWKEAFKKKKSRPKHVLKDIDFDACMTAYRKAREETALLYIHLLPTHDLLPKLPVKDPIGRKFHLPLDRYVFVLQRKVKPFRETLLEASAKKELPIYLSAFFSLLENRVSKGIYNTDPAIVSNFGFLDKAAIELDFGRYVEHPDFLKPSFQKVEKEKFFNELSSWIQKEMPHEAATFENTLAEFTR